MSTVNGRTDAATSRRGRATAQGHLPPEIANSPALRVLDAAVGEFAARGYGGTSVKTVAAAAGLTPSAMYAHYPSKEELLFVVCKLGHELGHTALVTDDDPAAGPGERLHAALLRSATWHASYTTLAGVCQRELFNLTPEHRSTVAETRRATMTFLRDRIEEGIREGVFAPCDVPTASLAMIGIIIDLTRWFRPQGRNSVSEAAQDCADLSLAMMSRPIA
jgi:AcrR family transcriptional regulator